MAIGRYTRKTVELISERDSAIDGGYEEYLASGYDESKLKLVEGERPTRFRLRRLSANARAHLRSLRAPLQYLALNPTQQLFAMAHGLEQVTGFEMRGDDGAITGLTINAVDDMTDDGELGPRLRADAIARLDLPDSIVEEIALTVYKLSEGEIPFVSKSATPLDTGGK